jgi:hypothetical protein
VLDKPNYRSRASLMADEFSRIDTRTEILRIVSEAANMFKQDDLQRGTAMAVNQERRVARAR